MCCPTRTTLSHPHRQVVSPMRILFCVGYPIVVDLRVHQERLRGVLMEPGARWVAELDAAPTDAANALSGQSSAPALGAVLGDAVGLVLPDAIAVGAVWVSTSHVGLLRRSWPRTGP